MGLRGRQYFENNFERDMLLNQLNKKIVGLRGDKS